MDNNEIVSEIWPDDMVAVTAEEQPADSPTMFPVDNQPENVDKQAEIDQPPKQESGEQPATPGDEETQTETGTAENQEGETPAPIEETPAEVTEPDVPSGDGELFTGVRTVLELPDGSTPETTINEVKKLVEYRDQNRKVNKQLTELLVTEKSYANFTRELMSGIPLIVALARNFDIDSLKPDPGEEDYSKYKDAIETRKAKLADEQKSMNVMRENQSITDKNLRSFAQAEGFKEKDATEFFGSLEADLVALQEGKITPEFLELYKKGKRYDADIANAKKTATIAARNQKIVAEKAKNITESEPPSLQPTGTSPEPVNGDPNDWVTQTLNKLTR